MQTANTLRSAAFSFDGSWVRMEGAVVMPGILGTDLEDIVHQHLLERIASEVLLLKLKNTASLVPNPNAEKYEILNLLKIRNHKM